MMRVAYKCIVIVSILSGVLQAQTYTIPTGTTVSWDTIMGSGTYSAIALNGGTLSIGQVTTSNMMTIDAGTLGGTISLDNFSFLNVSNFNFIGDSTLSILGLEGNASFTINANSVVRVNVLSISNAGFTTSSNGTLSFYAYNNGSGYTSNVVTRTGNGIFNISGGTIRLDLSSYLNAVASGTDQWDLFQNNSSAYLDLNGLNVLGVEGEIFNSSIDGDNISYVYEDTEHRWTFTTNNVLGTMIFDHAAIPEPSTFVALTGMLTLGFALCRRRR